MGRAQSGAFPGQPGSHADEYQHYIQRISKNEAQGTQGPFQPVHEVDSTHVAVSWLPTGHYALESQGCWLANSVVQFTFTVLSLGGPETVPGLSSLHPTPHSLPRDPRTLI